MVKTVIQGHPGVLSQGQSGVVKDQSQSRTMIWEGLRIQTDAVEHMTSIAVQESNH